MMASRLNNLNVKDAFHHHTFQSRWSDCSIPDSGVTDSRTEPIIDSCVYQCDVQITQVVQYDDHKTVAADRQAPI